ncbi:ABC transporter permease [Filibacter tadaridae]|uniref:Glutathione transport system permease protein GsiC n=1 Tax=Filibacter tadaridae TaxID=2483811 RepID=A0A3P5WR67_9BACL|nr:ABC transporter permease [Filibacter tadaridae]VDC24208.1 Glutathione transport system permease protein GsiC [Filibacter tadaridae]
MSVKWFGKRMVMGTIVLLVISFLSFFIMHLAPGDPATAFYGGNAQTLNTAEKERISRAFSLDRPVIEQYGLWLKEILQGNLGYSSKEGRPVTVILLERLPNTLLLFGVTLFFIIIGSLWLGTVAGMQKGSLWDKGLSTISIATSSIPSFWLGILFISFFSVKLGILPSSGTGEVGGDGGILDKLRHLIMPAAVIILTHTGIYARFLQESIKAETSKYYVMVAKANGVLEREIRKGVLRNASIPYLNYIGMTIPSFFGGSIIVESLFSWAGLGQLLVKAVMMKDFPLIMGGILFTGLLVVFSLFIIDLVMYAVDPKLRKGAYSR